MHVKYLSPSQAEAFKNFVPTLIYKVLFNNNEHDI